MMKLIIGFLSLISLASCKKEAFSDDYERSLRTWQRFKTENSNSYQYKKTFGSWTGSSSEYIIKVKNGKIVEQSFQQFWLNRETQTPELKESWVETEASINSHHNSEPALTLDEVYKKAKQEWLKVNKDENEIYFETKNNGMISSCGYFPKNCADDCFRGISIEWIKAL